MNKRVSLRKVVTVAFIGVFVISSFLYGLRTYNELVNMEHFLEVAHGRLLVEMQRRQVVVAGCRNAVAMYANMEGKLQDHLIALHRLTKAHGPRAEIVKGEALEIVKLVRELDLLIEKYPGLKSKGPYVLLMETLQQTGYQVVTERLNYNNWTYNYNVTCRLFPHRILAMLFGFREQPFLEGPLDYPSPNYSLLKED
ncbi:MAG: LemA family protein [Syntrophales bacterium]|jgi:LemA protein